MYRADGLIMFWEGANAVEDAARRAKARERDFIRVEFGIVAGVCR